MRCHRKERCRAYRGLGVGVETLGADCQNGQGDTNVGYGAYVGRHGSARGNERDVDQLDGGTNNDAGLDIAKDKANNKATNQGTSERVVTNRGAAHARQGCQAGK